LEDFDTFHAERAGIAFRAGEYLQAAIPFKSTALNAIEHRHDEGKWGGA
jgi:hypothetical protein